MCCDHPKSAVRSFNALTRVKESPVVICSSLYSLHSMQLRYLRTVLPPSDGLSKVTSLTWAPNK